MTQSVYLYCNLYAKRDKVIIPADCMEAIISEMRNSATTQEDYETLNETLDKLNNGERVYCDDLKNSYFQKVKSLGVTALDVQRMITNG